MGSTGLVGLLAVIGIASGAGAAPPARPLPERARWQAIADRVTIARDEWGIAHVHGKSDADAVFGMVYAQAEDDFNRVETNYLTALGRLAEAEGEKAIWQDLRQRLFLDPADLRTDYAASPVWLKALMDDWAAGLNYYLATHPKVHPRAIRRFEPWMALAFTEGSIGGDIERVNLDQLKALYGGDTVRTAEVDNHLIEPRGSNGIAIAPSNTIGGHAMLLINPHTSFFFRSELQMRSDAGLDAYGAVTWGQFFVYQGFNATAGWMHTSSGVDAVDEFAETLVSDKGKLAYRCGTALRPVTTKEIVIAYKGADGGLSEGSFTARYTHHGPIVRREADGRFVAMALMNKPVPALEQSFLRTKTQDYASFLKVAGLQANSSNDTLFADAKGEIAYLHPQFVPVRDDRFDYRAVVDGADAATDWHGLTPLDALPHLVNPPSGWVMNTNNEPWGAGGPGSLDKAAFPRYMDMAGPNPRGEHATTLLTGVRDFTPEKLIASAYDPWMPTFQHMVPLLTAAWDRLPAGEEKTKLAEPVASLKAWDDRWSAASVATSLGVYWATDLYQGVLPEARKTYQSPWSMMEATTNAGKLAALDRAMATLTADFGRWQVPWGEINRYQRNDGAIVQTFDDAKPSIAVPFASALWGSLASFGAKPYPGTKKWYGTSGNSFVAVVEFGPKVRAWAVTAGGESGDPASPHFGDQADRYVAGNLRPVHYYPEDIAAHTARTYHPGG